MQFRVLISAFAAFGWYRARSWVHKIARSEFDEANSRLCRTHCLNYSHELATSLAPRPLQYFCCSLCVKNAPQEDMDMRLSSLNRVNGGIVCTCSLVRSAFGYSTHTAVCLATVLKMCT